MPESIPQAEASLRVARRNAFELGRTVNALKSIVLAVVVAAVVGSLLYYLASQGNWTSHVRPIVGETRMREKVAELEKEIQLLKSDLAVPEQSNGFKRTLQTAGQILIANWVVISFLFGICAALYVKWRFKIDYFETYRDQATKKMLSEFYRHLGDRLMISSEWDAAEAAYRDSLAINPTNIRATYSLAEVGVFQPLKGEKWSAPEVTTQKLDYLIENPPPNPSKKGRRHDLARLYYLKGLSRGEAGDENKDREFQEKAIAQDPGFVGPHLQLGYLHEGAGELDQAIACYQKAVALEPELALANHNLGGAYLTKLDFTNAIRYLNEASGISPSLLTAIALGDAYAYSRQAKNALAVHTDAVRVTAIPEIEKERYIRFGGTWLWNFMPLHKDDTETIKRTVRIYSFEQKKMLALYSLALDHALLGQLDKADRQLNLARSATETEEFTELFVNRLQSLPVFVDIPADVRSWFVLNAQRMSTQP
jgi:tetratricopeptide (TPR) repeat protein